MNCIKTLLLFLFFAQFSCSKSKYVELNYKEKDYRFTISDLKKNILFNEIPRTVPYQGESLTKISNSILNDSIIILKSFEPFNKRINLLDWKENPFNNDTWQLYYQNLLFVSSLNHTYKVTNKKQYHTKAKAYIESYIKSHKKLENTTSKFSWYDHSCAFRVTHIFQTISNELEYESPDVEFIQRCFDHLAENIKYMIDTKNYSVHNHSLMMDRSLLYASKAFISNSYVSKDLKEIASKRSLNSFDKIIGPSGLANEHSITYHIFNHNLYKKIFELIGQESTPSDKLLKYLKMNDVLLQLVKPDLTFPLWGDSQIEKLSPKLIDDFESDIRLESVLANYNLRSMVSFENNIGTLRTQTSDKSYLTLFANYNSKVHKHHDDLSFVFQTLGVDIFTDQGYYGYENKYRPKLMSVFGHNTLAINNKDYTLGRKDQYSKLTSYTKNEDYEILDASHNLYDSITVNRKLLYVKPNLLVIKDSVSGHKNDDSLQQTYNIGKGVTDIKINTNSVRFSMPNNLSVSMFTTHKDNVFKEKDFYRSLAPYYIEDSKQVVLQSNHHTITTVVLIDSEAYTSPVKRPIIKNNTLLYLKDNTEYKINLK